MSAQGLLNSVFSCSSTASKTISKRKLRQTRSLDPALIRDCAAESGEAHERTASGANWGPTGASSHPRRSPQQGRLSSASVQLSCSDNRNATGDLAANLWGASQSLSGSGTVFSPRKWLQKRFPQTDALDTFSYDVWKSEGDFIWRSECGRCFHLKPVSLQSLSELERVRLQEVAIFRLLEDYDLGCQITIPKDGHKRKKSLRRKLDSLGKEKKDKECVPQAFGVPLQQVIANDRWFKLRQEHEGHQDPAELLPSLLHLAGRTANNREFCSSNSSLSSAPDNYIVGPGTLETVSRARRRGGMSVDCITDLDDGQSRLLEALQLSLPAEPLNKKEKKKNMKLSLNPVYRQVPHVVDCCCQHLEKYGLQTVGIFRVGSSKKRVRQLREEFDQGTEVSLGPNHSVHDVAALLKEFLRDLPDPLLTRELYSAFISSASLDTTDQLNVLQLLICLLPPCNSDTLQRLLQFLSTVANHAEDTRDSQGQEFAGNKMTSQNLATIFGPNLLHKQKSSDKEFIVQSSARAEDSAAVISVVRRMITSHETLFTIPPELQHEVLASLLETDCDVVDYLLRRKAHWESPATPQPEETYCVSERSSSSNSNKTSSGEVSPYENNSPTLCHWLSDKAPGSERVRETVIHAGHVKAEAIAEKACMWGTWHATLKGGLSGRPHSDTGSCGSLSESVFFGSPVASHTHRGTVKEPVRRTNTSPVMLEDRNHPPITRSSSSPVSATPQYQPQRHLKAAAQWKPLKTVGSYQLEGLRSTAISPSASARPPPPYPGPQKSPIRSSGSRSPKIRPTNLPEASLQSSSQTQVTGHGSVEYHDWQRDKWQIWQLLQADNVDTLPETLV